MSFERSILQILVPGLHCCQQLRSPLLKKVLSFFTTPRLLPCSLFMTDLICKKQESSNVSGVLNEICALVFYHRYTKELKALAFLSECQTLTAILQIIL